MSFLQTFYFSFHFLYLSTTCSNATFPSIQPTLKEHKELVWLAGNLKLEVIGYSKLLYGPNDNGGVDYDDDDDDDDSCAGGGSESTPSYQPRKRRA